MTSPGTNNSTQSRTSQIRIWVATVPAITVAAIFEIFLGHRHDYTGHYLAGYGATFAAVMLWMRTLSVDSFARVANRWVVPLCVACIAMGAVAEATAFRIAKFDEIDFCNQSLGAVLAAICAIGYIEDNKPADKHFDHGLIAGIIFLGAGGCFAVA